MKILETYVRLVDELLEKPRNNIDRKVIKSKNKKYEELSLKYDKLLLEKYRHIEKLLDEECQKD